MILDRNRMFHFFVFHLWVLEAVVDHTPFAPLPPTPSYH